MSKTGPKFHHIADGGTFNLNCANGKFSTGFHHQIRFEKFYDRVAPFYGIWAALVESRAGRRAYELAQLTEGESVLEVAVGSGEFYSLLFRTEGLRRCVGVDQSSRMLACAGNRLKGGGKKRPDLCCADARRLPFAEGTFDVLFNFYMLDLFPESEISAVAREFCRVLNPSGRLIVLSMATQAPIINAIWMWLYKRSPLLVGGCRPIPVAALLAEGGWRIEVQEQISQGGFRSDLIVAKVPVRSCQP